MCTFGQGMTCLGRYVRSQIAVCFSLAVALSLKGGETKPAENDQFLPPQSRIERIVPKVESEKQRLTDPGVIKGDGKVIWQSWNDESFARATREGKLICVFVTAPWCQRGG